MDNPYVRAATVLLLCGMLYGGYLLYAADRSGAFDPRLQRALEALQNLETYEARVETTTALAERRMSVLGLYRLNFKTNRYGSYATTSLTIPNEPPRTRTHVFTLTNLSIDADIYVKIDTESPLLQKTIPYSENWRHFKSDSIPTPFIDIAVPGPVLDNLALFGRGGRYLALSDSAQERTYAGETFFVYPFTLSKAAHNVEGGTLRSLVNRIGTSTLYVWIDSVASIRMITVSTPNYVSTTTLIRVNTPLDIEPPHRVE